MNKQETAEAIKVMQAFVDGADIQYVNNISQDAWEDGKPTWQWPFYSYRIKPKEPREFWLCWNNGESVDSCRFEIKPDQYDENTVEHWDNHIKVREVLDEG